jgi:hypothetical protein
VASQSGEIRFYRKATQSFVGDVLARKDRGNDGVKPSEAIDIVQEMNPALTREQAMRHFNKTLLKSIAVS